MAAAPSPGGGQQPVAAAPPPVGQLVAAPPAGAQQLIAAMPPPPPRPPKRKEVVLDEDEYTATLEAIIERDFFPELPKLESKIAWLQAVRSGDPEQIRHAQLLIAQRRAAAAAGRPLTGLTPAGAPLFTPGGTAARVLEGDTPYVPMLPPGIPVREGTGAGGRPGTAANPAAPAGDVGAGAGAAADDVGAAPPVSLDQFLAQHTSEDNASFQEILEAVNARKRQKHAKQLAAGPDPKLLITDGREKTDGFGTTGQDPSTLVTWKHNPKNALFYGNQKDVVPFSDAELAAQVQGAPKAINHSGTRFPKDLQPSASATPSSSSAGGSVTAGSGRGAAAGGAVGAGPAGRGAAALAAAAGGTRGYDILATPSFDPGVESTPFMTWGDIEGTPLRIEAEDLPPGPLMGGPSFFIKEGSAKEQKMRELANKAGASLRKKGASLRGGTPVVTSTLAAAAAARRQGTGLPSGGAAAAAAAARPTSGRPASGRPPRGAAAAGQKPLSDAAKRLASSLHKGRQGKTDDLGLRASYRGPTPGSSRRGTTPATSAGGFGSSWSTAPTPSRGGSVAPSPAVHATLEEEEARVQALLRARQKELEGKARLEEARTAAVKAMQHVTQSGPQPHVERPAAAGAAQQQQQQRQRQQADGGGDLTAGLLNL
ncbi:DGCR14 [Chlorella sorokiniana]|uniref:DGCR14 n=1 Tax=Chlorella sorokiniana TaxID=3076 RepID=A0A2P6TN76_CHLSO|nr:DGCR14 [Chlorella sorokiniana]|eukprot:PRW50786.1 DGCR14 [Chlorella sorokiniana]